MKKKDKNHFITLSKNIHGDKYDYSKVEYINNRTKVCIICPIHGEFWQRPSGHTQGHDCPECGKIKFKNKMKTGCVNFVKQAKEIHGDKYDYSKVEYINSNTKVSIICPIHGEFEQLPLSHLQGIGCPECGKIKRSNSKKLTNEQFIERCKNIHGDLYDYSLTNYISMKDKVSIICSKHGEFEQIAHVHINGHGCPQCSDSKLENIVKDILIKNNIKFIQQYKPEWLKDIRHIPVDFFLPDYNIVIECQGLQHFEPSNFGSKKNNKEKMFEKIQEHDKLKLKLCEQHKIKILYFSNLKIKFPYKVITNEIKLLNEIKNDF